MVKQLLIVLGVFLCLSFVLIGSVQALPMGATEVWISTDSGFNSTSPATPLDLAVGQQAIFGFGSQFDTSVTITSSGGGADVFVYSGSGSSPLSNPFSSVSGWSSVGSVSAAGGSTSTTIGLTDGPFSYLGIQAPLGIQALSAENEGGDSVVVLTELSVSVNPVPEPSTMVLFGLGIIGLAGLGRRKLNRQAL